MRNSLDPFPKDAIELADHAQVRVLLEVVVVRHRVVQVGGNAAGRPLQRRVDVVDPRRQLVFKAEVVVGPEEVLVVFLGSRDFAEATGVVPVPILGDVQDLLHLRRVQPGLARRAIQRITCRCGLAARIEIAEEEGLVLYNRPGETDATLPVAEGADFRVRGGRVRYARQRGEIAHQSLIALEPIAGTAERVAAALGDGVDRPAGKTALPHVVGRDRDLDFLDDIETDRLRACRAPRRAGGADGEDVVVDGAVDLHVVVPVVPAGDVNDLFAARGVLVEADEGRRARVVEHAARNRRQVLDRFRPDVRRRSGPR